MSEVQTLVVPPPCAEGLLELQTSALRLVVAGESAAGLHGQVFHGSAYSWTFVRDAADRARAKVLKWRIPAGAAMVVAACVLSRVPIARDRVWAQALAVVLLLGPFVAGALTHKWLERGLWHPRLGVSVELATTFVASRDGADPKVRVLLDAMRPGLFELLGDLEVAVEAAHDAGDIGADGAPSPEAARRDALLGRAVAVTAFARTAAKAGVMPVSGVPDLPLVGATPARRRLAVAMQLLTRPSSR